MQFHETKTISDQILSGKPVDGMKSRLYPYQRASVAEMLQRELYPGFNADPTYLRMVGMNEKAFYLQPDTMEVLIDCPLMGQIRGGILCEELGIVYLMLSHTVFHYWLIKLSHCCILGTGKTVMTLALIVATIGQLSQPEESFHDARPVLTPLAFRNFPIKPFVAARKRIPRCKEPDSSIPSLVELLIHYIRVVPDKVDLRKHEHWLKVRHLWHLQELNAPFYFHYDDKRESQAPHSTRRQRGEAMPPRAVFLTSASLVVVPPNLLSQWNSEIYKHCHSSVRVLMMKPGNEFPSARMLTTQYDVRLATMLIDHFIAHDGADHLIGS